MIQVVRLTNPLLESTASSWPMAKFDSLPPELVTEILRYFDWNDLLVLQRVCKWLNDITKIPRLQYETHLSIFGYEDVGVKSDVLLEDRSETLLAIERSFTLGRFRRREYSLTGTGRLLGIRRGVMALEYFSPHSFIPPPPSLRFIKFPSAEGEKLEGWELSSEELPPSIVDSAIDPMQDLLVTFHGGQPVFPAGPRTMRFVSMTTGRPHPLAKLKRIPIEPSSSSLRALYGSIMDDYVGVLLVPYKLSIWNWRTGRLHASVKTEGNERIWEFFFLDANNFALVRGYPKAAGIEIWHLCTENDTEPEKSYHRATFWLPKLHQAFSLIVNASTSQGSSSFPRRLAEESKSSHPHMPFLKKDDESVRVLGLSVLNDRSRRYERHHTVIVPRAVFTWVPVECGSDRAIMEVPSDEWMSQTYTMRDHDIWTPLDYCGSRVAMAIRNRGFGVPSHSVVVMDFNPRLLSWARSQGYRRWDTTMTVGMGQTTAMHESIRILEYESYALFPHEWSSQLPFIARKICDIWAESNQFLLQMDEERLVVLYKDSATNQPMSADVYSIEPPVVAPSESLAQSA